MGEIDKGEVIFFSVIMGIVVITTGTFGYQMITLARSFLKFLA